MIKVKKRPPKHCLIIVLATLLAGILNPLAGGVTGTIMGFTYDAETGQPLPGVHITVDETELQGISNKYGFYVINNVPAGKYDVFGEIFSYAPIRIKNAVIKTDLISRIDLHFDFQPLMLQPVPEVVITADRHPVKHETYSSTYYLDKTELLSRLPIDSFLDGLKFIPGIYRNNIRGGRNDDVMYFVDGLPVMNHTTRELSLGIPASSISEVLVYKGGFSAEYGNATSGVVNIITKRGRNQFSATARTYSDNLGPISVANDQNNRLEFAFGGPMAIGFGGPVAEMNYYLSADVGINNTPQDARLRQFFDNPIQSNYNVSAVSDFKITRNIALSLQGMRSDWRWRSYDSSLEPDLSSTPLRRNKRWRINSRLTHTLSPTLFYYISASLQDANDSVQGGQVENSPASVISGSALITSALQVDTQPWQQEMRESLFYLDAAVVKHLSNHINVKSGFSGEYFSISLDSERYLSLPGPRTDSQFEYVRFNSDYKQRPRHLSGFVEMQFEYPFLRARAGARVEHLNANFPVAGGFLQSPPVSLEASGVAKYAFSPRLSLSFPVRKYDRLNLNYGHYAKIPSLYYLYASEGSVATPGNNLAIFGNPDLQPVSAKTAEILYITSLSEQASATFSAFHKDFEDQIDIQKRSVNPLDNNSFPVYYYENRASSRAYGFEIEFNKSFSSRLQFSAAYAWLRQNGDFNFAEERYLEDLAFGEFPARTRSSLNYDQRHSFLFSVRHNSRRGLYTSLNMRSFSDRDWYDFSTNGYRSVSLPWRNFIDLRMAFPLKTAGVQFQPYFEIRNLLDEQVQEPRDAFFLLENQPQLPFDDQYGRRFRIGVTLNSE